MLREKILTALSRIMFAVAGIAAASLILEYGFYLDRAQRGVLHLVDLAIVAVFVADAIVRFTYARRKTTYLRSRWPGLAIVALMLIQLGAVAHLRGRGWLPAFLEGRSVFSIAKAYIVVVQVYLVYLIGAEMVRLNRRIASLKIHPARTVIFSFAAIIVVGALLLSTPRATPEQHIPVVDAIFTATSAVCVTGLVVRDTGRDFTTYGHGIILALIQIGGLGLITFTAFFSLVMRRELGVRESLVARSMLSFEAVGRIGRTLRLMIGFTLLVEGVGALMLFVATRPDFRTAGAALWRSIFHSVSAFCNAGLSLYSTSFERYAGSVPVNLTMTTLIILGGLGFPVIMNLLGRPVLRRGLGTRGRRFSLHSRIVLVMTAALLIVGTVAFLCLEWDGVLAGRGFGQKLMVSYFGSVTARTAGFNTVRTSALGLPVLFLLAGLMFIGGSPGGTAGGVKTVTFGLVLASVSSMFGGKRRVELAGRHVPEKAINEALVVVAMGLLVVSAGTFILLIVEDLPLSEVLFEVVSAFGTVGLSTGVTPTLSVAGKVALMLIMLTGRIGPLTLALAIGQRRARALYDYPEERVVIG